MATLATLGTMLGYAAFLERFKDRFEPDLTWLWVVIGIVACTALTRLRVRPTASWRDYERAAVTTYSQAGSVIIGWQLWRSYRRHRLGEAI